MHPTTEDGTIIVHRTAPAPEHPCELLRYHAPEPNVTQYHHSKPVFLQNRLYGRIIYGPDLWVCGTCHDSIHAWLYWMLGERSYWPEHTGAAKAEAQRALDWYRAEQKRLGLT